MNKRIILRAIGLALMLASIPLPGVAQSAGEKQEYVIGVGDVLSVKFWQRPELDTEARVSSNGKIDLPLVGAIPAAGLTVSRLRQDIVNRVSLLDIRITQASIVVREFGSKVVYVTGAVLAPGKLKFETIPNLWQIILEAGGPHSYAQLREVTVVRGFGPDVGRTIRVDLNRAIERGELAALPPVYPGDNVHVADKTPSLGLEGGVFPIPAQSNVIHVIGQVAKPGAFELETGMDVYDAIVRAGGPTQNANLKDVRLYFHGQHQAEVALIDMEKYLKQPSQSQLKLHEGDAIYVPARRELPRFPSAGFHILLAFAASFTVVQMMR